MTRPIKCPLRVSNDKTQLDVEEQQEDLMCVVEVSDFVTYW